MSNAVLIALAVLLGQTDAPDAHTILHALEAEPRALVFEQAEAWSSHTATVQVRNTTSELAIVETVENTCFCTDAVMADRFIPPGETRAVEVTLDLRNYPSNEIVSGVRLTLQTPNAAALVIPISGSVVPEFEVHPPIVDFGDVRIHRSAVVDIEIVRNQPEPIRKLGLLAADGLEMTEHPPDQSETTQARKSWRYSVRLSGALPKGRFASKLLVKSDVERLKDLEIPVRARVVPPRFEITPLVVVLGGPDSSDSTAELNISCSEPFTVSEATPSTPAATVTVDSDKCVLSHTLRVESREHTPESDRLAAIRLELKLNAAEYVESRFVHVMLRPETTLP